MPEKDVSAIPGWRIEYPNNYIAGKEVKVIAVSQKAQLSDLKVFQDIYAAPMEFDISRFTNPTPGAERAVFIKGLKGRPLEILLADFSSESWAIIRSARENVKKVTEDEERLICECIIVRSERRWSFVTTLLTGRLLKYQDILVFGGFLKSEAQATRKIDEPTLSAHRVFIKEGLNKRLSLDDKKVREIQGIVRASETGRYGLETVLKVTDYQKILKEKANYEGKIDGYWGAETERAHKLLIMMQQTEAEIARIWELPEEQRDVQYLMLLQERLFVLQQERRQEESVLAELKKNLEAQEGRKKKSYDDSKGIRTVSVGFKLTRGDARQIIEDMGLNYDDVFSGKQELTDAQIDNLLDLTAKELAEAARRVIPGFNTLPKVAQEVFAGMAFQMGATGLSEFKKMIAALKSEPIDWNKVADEMLDSTWAKYDSPDRAKELARRIRQLGGK
jgi:GH24 family phage-related lysozyme (muramidase)